MKTFMVQSDYAVTEMEDRTQTRKSDKKETAERDRI